MRISDGKCVTILIAVAIAIVLCLLALVHFSSTSLHAAPEASTGPIPTEKAPRQ